MLNLNTKGFTLLELIVVIAIIGGIAAAGFPSFMNWSADRKVRSANEKVATLITGLNTQTQRGVYPFTQILITPQINSLQIEAKGKTKSTINTLGGNLTCNTDDDDFWDETISTLNIDNVFTHIEDESAICFSKNADNYMVTGDIEDNQGNSLTTDDGVDIINYLIFCNSDNGCDTSPETPSYMVIWSRFGNVSKFKYNSSGEWVRQ